MATYDQLKRFTWRELESLRYEEIEALSVEQIACRLEERIHSVRLVPESKISLDTILQIVALFLELFMWYQSKKPDPQLERIAEELAQTRIFLQEQYELRDQSQEAHELLLHTLQTLDDQADSGRQCADLK